ATANWGHRAKRLQPNHSGPVAHRLIPRRGRRRTLSVMTAPAPQRFPLSNDKGLIDMSSVEVTNGSHKGFKASRSNARHRTTRVTIPDSASAPSAIALPSPTVSLVIPARNEARNIAWVLEQIPDTVTEVVLVDGNSTDVTLATARRYRPDIRVVLQEGVGK